MLRSGEWPSRGELPRLRSAGVTADYFRIFGNDADVRQVGAGESVFHVGEPADCFYVVRSGSVRIHDGEHELETLGEGGIFGELALVDGRPRSATATAVSETTVVSIDERRFHRLVQETPYFAQAVMRVMAERLRRNAH
jgi:CRP/FNR family transcriptional regulator, cyclic AMP receptor protein